MTRLIRCALAVALGFGALQASAESNENRGNGQISYISPATLEIGINKEVFRLDSGFRIHGLGEADRVELLNALELGMYVQFRTSSPDGTGTIQEIWVRAD